MYPNNNNNNGHNNGYNSLGFKGRRGSHINDSNLQESGLSTYEQQQYNNFQLQQRQFQQHQQQQQQNAMNNLRSPTMNGFNNGNNGNRLSRRSNSSNTNLNILSNVNNNTNNNNNNNSIRNNLLNSLQPPIPQQIPYGHHNYHHHDSVPQTPFDLNYGASMLPANLLSPFIGSSFNSPMAASMSPNLGFQSHYSTVSGPAPPKIGAVPKNKKKGIKSNYLKNKHSKVKNEENNEDIGSDSEAESSEDDVIITEGPGLKDEENDSSFNEENSVIKKERKIKNKSKNKQPTVNEQVDDSNEVSIINPIKELSNKEIILCHLNPNIKIHEFLNYLKFGPLQFCYILNDDEEIKETKEIKEIELKLKFIYQRTQINFINHFHLYIDEFYQEFKSPNATYKIINYDSNDDYVMALPLKEEEKIDMENEIEVNKATRCIKISNFTSFKLLNDDHENLEKKLKLKFGEVDLINTNEHKNVMTIHFLSLISSIRLFKELDKEKNDSKENLGKFKYYEDRCCQLNDDEFEQTFGQTSDFNEHLENESDYQPQELFIPPPISYQNNNHLLPAHLINNNQMNDLTSTFQALNYSGNDLIPPIMQNINSLNTNENRTVYLGNLSPKTTVEEICNVVRGGILQSIKLIHEKNICFITFITALSATQFFASSNMNGLTIHNKKIKVGWGKNPGDLPNSIALAVTVGASRNVYIGVKDEDDETNESPKVVPDEPTIRKDFSKYGDIEQINFFKDGYCAFVNFMNITSAIKAIDDFHGNDKFAIHQSFDNRYIHYKINFAKDRCGNPPKFINRPKKKKVYKKKVESNQEGFDKDLTEEQALAFASIGIKSNYIDEKVKQSEINEENLNHEETLNSTPKRSSTPNNKNSIISSQNSSPSNINNFNHFQRHSQSHIQFTPIQQQDQSPYISPNNYGNLLISQAQPRKHPSRSMNQSQSSSHSSQPSNGLGSSGSQVMLQYLAKAQFDNLMFNPRKDDKKKKNKKTL